MAETTGSRFDIIKAVFRLGGGAKAQSCDGTFTNGNLPKYGSDGMLTDSGVAASGTGGGGTAVSETPSGTLDGTNMTFGLSHTPLANTLTVYLNGIEQDLGRWVSVSGNTLTFTVAPLSIDYIVATYRY